MRCRFRLAQTFVASLELRKKRCVRDGNSWARSTRSAGITTLREIRYVKTQINIAIDTMIIHCPVEHQYSKTVVYACFHDAHLKKTDL